MSYHLYILHFITQEQIFWALKLTPPKRPTWPPFCGPDLFKFDQIFSFTFSNTISYAYQISSSCNI